MSFNRLGTLAAGLLGVGWLVAMGIQLGVWLPQLQGTQPGFLERGDTFLRFVQQNFVTWRFFHIGTTVGLIGLVVVIGLLGQVNREDERWLAFTAVGLIGVTLALLASLFDHLATPVLARFAQVQSEGANPGLGTLVAYQLWEVLEPWRDAGMKTVSFWFLGIWAAWQGGQWRRQDVLRLGQFSQLMGWALLVLAFLETMIPAPWVYRLGETGWGGLALLLIPIWGLWTAHWFWRRELAAVNE